jgi:hypothetical protein
MRFYNLNIRHYRTPGDTDSPRVSHAKKWLDERKRAPIFYGRSTVAGILAGDSGLSGLARSQAQSFCQIGQEKAGWANTLIVTIDDGYVWVFKPVGPIEEHNEAEYYPDLTKSFPIEILKRTPIRDVPLVLASMKCAQNFSRGTFAEIAYADGQHQAGNVAAICHVLGTDTPDTLSLNDRLDCFCSVEFETLVAKLLEENGLFVPAYKGGFIKDIDLIAANDSDHEIAIDQFIVPPGKSRSVEPVPEIRTD